MKKRLFVAINLDNAAKLALVKLVAQLPNSTALNKTKIDNLHLTLQFLGDTEESLIPDLQNILEKTVQQFHPFELSFTQLGAFPNWQTPHTIWIGLVGPGLKELQTELAHQLIKIVPTMDTKPFQPHLTLVRVKSQFISDEFNLIKSVQTKINLPVEQIAHIYLMESTLTPHGPIYTILSHHQLT